MRAILTHERLSEMLRRHKAAYHAAAPFPSIVLDDLIPRAVIDQLARETPEGAGGGNEPGYSMLDGDEGHRLKTHKDDEGQMGPATRTVFAVLKSSYFVRFLELLTNIEGLVPDPQFIGAGVHRTLAGGSLQVHADFNFLPRIGMWRRVNLFLYLNDDWPEEYGGHLELWPRDLSSCARRVLPSAGRLVLFTSSDFSYHGHPRPLRIPETRARRSLALYYYTAARPPEMCRAWRGEQCESSPTHWIDTLS